MNGHQNKFQANPLNGSRFMAVLSFVLTRLALWLGWRNFREFFTISQFSQFLRFSRFSRFGSKMTVLRKNPYPKMIKDKTKKLSAAPCKHFLIEEIIYHYSNYKVMLCIFETGPFDRNRTIE